MGKLLNFCSRKVISSKWHPRKTRQEGKRGAGVAPGYCDGPCRQWFPHGRAWASPSGWGMFLTYVYICVNLQVKHYRCTVRDSQWPSTGGDQGLKAQVSLVGRTKDRKGRVQDTFQEEWATWVVVMLTTEVWDDTWAVKSRVNGFLTGRLSDSPVKKSGFF